MPLLLLPSPLSLVRAAAPLAVLALALAGCGDGGEASGDRATVVVSSSIWGDVATEVVGDCADVEVLVPAGVDPHSFELSARDAAELREADLVVVNGLGLEERIDGVVDDARAAGVPVLALGEHLDPRPLTDHEHADDEHADDEHSDEHADDGGHDHGGLDPHVWQDPERVAVAAGVIAEEVAEHTGCDVGALDDRAAEYAATVRAVDAEIADELAPIPPERRRLITDHDAFGYFADRFGFEVVGTIIPSSTTLAEPGSAQLAELIELVDSSGASAIVVEASRPSDLGEAIAAEAGQPVEVVELHSDSLGEAGTGAETYVGLLRTNASRLREALNPA